MIGYVPVLKIIEYTLILADLIMVNLIKNILNHN